MSADNQPAVSVANVILTHPTRVLYPDQGITKQDLARYYETIEHWLMPMLRERPLSLVRCPEGREGQCFYQKHADSRLFADLPKVRIREKHGAADYLYVEELRHVIQLVQAGTLELHVWGSRVGALEHPDMVVFDLDPAADVAWARVLTVARELRKRLRALDLVGFVRTTGGKGLHVVVPIEPTREWDDVKAFARGIADGYAHDDPEHLTTNPSKAQRAGRIFIDYLRNSRGATAIANYSTRARPGAPVAVPLNWADLAPGMTSDRYNVANLRRRLSALNDDPWRNFEESRRPLTRAILAAAEQS